MKSLVYSFLVILIAISCGPDRRTVDAEKAALQASIDSLKNLADANYRSVVLLDQVGALLDSIDANRKWIRLELGEGMAEQDYVERMNLLNEYVQKAESKIGELEKTRSAYAKQVKRLKEELELKNLEITALQEQVDLYKSENIKLSDKLTLTEADLNNVELRLEARQQELAMLEARLEGLIKATKVSEAESWFARGQGMEEVAERTQLAPRKKKEALKQALDHYKKAYELGYNEAKVKIEAIEKRLKK